MRQLIFISTIIFLISTLYSFNSPDPSGTPYGNSGLVTDPNDQCEKKVKNQVPKCDDAPRNVLVEVEEPTQLPPVCTFSNFFCYPYSTMWCNDHNFWYHDVQYLGLLSTEINCCGGYGTPKKEWALPDVSNDCKMQVRGHTKYHALLKGSFYIPCEYCNGSVNLYKFPANLYIPPLGWGSNISLPSIKIKPRYVGVTVNC